MDEVAPIRPVSMLPTRSPLSMPVQPLRPFQSRAAAPDRLTAPRLALLLLTVGMTGVFAYSLYDALSIAPITILQGLFLIFLYVKFRVGRSRFQQRPTWVRSRCRINKGTSLGSCSHGIGIPRPDSAAIPAL